LLQELERELERVRKQLHQSTKELSVLTEQITRLRTGARPEVVCASLELALGMRLMHYPVDGEAAQKGRGPLPATLSPHPEDRARWSR
jgi:hypothetical protein